MRSITTKFVTLLALALGPVFCAGAAQKINPLTQINWPLVTGSGAPSGSCTSSNYGQPYTNTANGNFYVCASTGWVLVAGGGGGGISGTGTTGFIPKFTGTTAIGNSAIDDSVTTANTITSTKPVAINDGTGVGGTVTLTEGTAATASSGKDILYADSTNHCIQYSANGGSFSCLGTGGSSSLTQGTPAVGNSSNVVASQPFTLFANPFATAGSGTEASPWTQADNTGGIQTALNSLVAGRGGELDLSPGRFNILTPITMTSHGTTVRCLGQGYNAQPNGDGEGTWGCKLRVDSSLSSGIAGVFQLGIVGGSYSTRSNGLKLESPYIWGTTATPAATLENNVGISINGWTDQPKIRRAAVSNFGVGIEVTGAGLFDGGTIEDADITANGYGIYLKPVTGTGDGSWFSHISSNFLADNGYHAIYAAGAGGSSSGFTGTTGDFLMVWGNSIGRGCTLSACAALTGKAANIYWERYAGLLFGNQIVTAGWNEATWVNADGVILKGNYNNLTSNVVAGQSQSTTAGVRVQGAHNYVHGNVMFQNNTDIIVDSGALDNIIDQPAATISDSGTRTVINGVSTNAGDPNTTGNWNGVAKWAGLIINDTTNNIQYLYLSPSSRIAIGGAVAGVSSITATSPCTANGASGSAQTGAVTIACSGGSSATAPVFQRGTFVQENSSTVASITSPSMTVNAGELVYVSCRGGNSSVTSVTVTDSLSNTWTSGTSQTGGPFLFGAFSKITNAGSATFTCTPNLSTQFQSMTVGDFAYPSASTPSLNVSTGKFSGATQWPSTSGVTTTQQTLNIACFALNQNSTGTFPLFIGGAPATVYMPSSGSFSNSSSDHFCEYNVVPYAVTGMTATGYFTTGTASPQQAFVVNSVAMSAVLSPITY